MLTKQQRIQLVLEGVLSIDYVTYGEVMEVLHAAEMYVAEREIARRQTHYTSTTLQ